MAFPNKITSILKKLPSKPGVYLFRDAKKNVLYVGKAKVLKHRVRSYFQTSASLEQAKRIMVKRIADIEYIIVDSEVEALLLESTLIKKHRPTFNVIFKDDKYYQYIRITLKDDYPAVETVRRITKDGSRYFGPYTSGYAVRSTLQLMKKIFPYKSCKEPPSKPCFDAKLGRCLGHDLGPGSKEQYREVVNRLMRFLEGGVEDTVKGLKLQMAEAASRKEYELAARLRDRIYAVEKMATSQKVVSTKLEDEDIVGMHRIADLANVTLFQIREGKLLNRIQFILQHTDGQTDADVLASFLSQYYSQSTDHPKTVLMPIVPSDAADLSRVLRIAIRAPIRGKKRKLVSLAGANAKDDLERKQREWLSKEARASLGLEELKHALLLVEQLQRIECYDISNIQGTNAVGSMVVFEHGLPKKSDYKKFRIKTVEGANDYAMLQEVIRRRFSHRHASPPFQGGVSGRMTGRGGSSPARGEDVPSEVERQEGWEHPDLVIIDGGKGQLNAALAVLRELKVIVPTIGLAKRQEEIFRPGRKDPIRLPTDSESLYLLQRIRDEAHRFAIGYYRKKHGTESTRSLLDEVPGIGPRAKKLLLERFGSVRGIREAEDAAIEALLGKRRTAVLREHL